MGCRCNGEIPCILQLSAPGIGMNHHARNRFSRLWGHGRALYDQDTADANLDEFLCGIVWSAMKRALQERGI